MEASRYSKADRQVRGYDSPWNLRKRSGVKHLIYSGVINAQELVCGGSHVDFIELTLGAFPVKELVHRFVSRYIFTQVQPAVKRILSVPHGILLIRLGSANRVSAVVMS